MVDLEMIIIIQANGFESSILSLAYTASKLLVDLFFINITMTIINARLTAAINVLLPSETATLSASASAGLNQISTTAKASYAKWAIIAGQRLPLYQ